jgi:two-component system phosphate regulon response regulator PhoB
LVIEDSVHSALILGDLLAREGFAVETAPDGRAAVARIANGLPTDVVILSANLPYVDGLEVLARIRSDSEWSRAIVIVLSGRGDEDEAVRALTSGASEYILRPYSPRELVVRIRRHRATGQ